MLANDLNPISYKYLQQNITLNKVQRDVTAFNMDGRAFIRQQCNLAEPAAAELQKRDGMYSPRQLVAQLQCTASRCQVGVFLGSSRDETFCSQKQLNALHSDMSIFASKYMNLCTADTVCTRAQVQILRSHWRRLVSQAAQARQHRQQLL